MNHKQCFERKCQEFEQEVVTSLENCLSFCDQRMDLLTISPDEKKFEEIIGLLTEKANDFNRIASSLRSGRVENFDNKNLLEQWTDWSVKYADE